MPHDSSLPDELPIFRFMRYVGPAEGQSLGKDAPEMREAGIYCSIMVLNSVMERAGNRILENHELTMPQWLALGAVLHAGEAGISHGQLSQRMMLSKAPTTGLVDRLARAGMVKRKPDKTDRRVSRVSITPAGETPVERGARNPAQQRRSRSEKMFGRESAGTTAAPAEPSVEFVRPARPARRRIGRRVRSQVSGHRAARVRRPQHCSTLPDS